MKRLLTFISVMFLASNICFSQEHTKPALKYIFDPAANAAQDLSSAIATAGKEHKNVLMLVGGDWSHSSIVFDATLRTEAIQTYLSQHYVFLRINFSPGNKNTDVLAAYNYPRYDGYPVLIVLDETGKMIAAKTCDDYRPSIKAPYTTALILHALTTWAEKKG